MRYDMLVAAVVLTGAVCQASDWVVDPVHSTVSFSVRHLMVSNVRGGFTNFSGSATYDPANPTAFAVEGKIDAASVSTGNAMRDGHLQSPDFFDAKKFPSITFKSKELKKSGDGYTLVGDMVMHGVTNSVTLQLTGLGEPVNFSGKHVGFSVTGQIDRSKFGLTYNKAIEAGGVVVGNEVQVTADIEMVEKAKTAVP